MAYPKFKPTKEFYEKYQGKKVQLKKKIVTVSCRRTESRGGSWERGFRFYNSRWAKLVSAKGRVSFDHGKTWYDGGSGWNFPEHDGFRRTKGKMRLSSSNHGEFAFEGIQKINRAWEGPGYRWRR